MRIKLGILSDPAKVDLYNSDFYSLLKNSQNDFIFHLIGASERDVTKTDYKLMFERFTDTIGDTTFSPIFSKSSNKYTSRIGLFPTSAKHLIKGPEFIFGPFPLNSKSNYLKLKSKISINVVSRLIKANIFKIGYLPQGGKAAKRTKALEDLDANQIFSLFQKVRNNSWFDYFYLEAGSGMSVLTNSKIKAFLSSIYSESNKRINEKKDLSSPTIIPKTIYGGGINSIEKLCEIINCENGNNLLPEMIIIGNVSEEDVSMTYKIVDKIIEFNSEMNFNQL